MADSKRYISREELKSHNKLGDLWISIQGKVYDVSDWTKDHSGDDLPLLSLAGQDFTDAFVAYHVGTASPYLDKFFTGYYLKDYNVSEVSKDYRKLVAEFSKMGLFEKEGHVLLYTLCFMAMLFAVSVHSTFSSDSTLMHLVCHHLFSTSSYSQNKATNTYLSQTCKSTPKQTTRVIGRPVATIIKSIINHHRRCCEPDGHAAPATFGKSIALHHGLDGSATAGRGADGGPLYTPCLGSCS